ncbi:hypothetical protein [Virgisporangium ochraceum]|nr:hypothetical protein [Virgisporangium ochraceum]
MRRNAFGQLYHAPWGRTASRLTHRVLRGIERLAARGRGPLARLAVRYLVRGMVTGHRYTDAEPVLRTLYDARDPRVAELARSGLDRAWSAGGDARTGVWQGMWLLARGDGHHWGRLDHLDGPLPAPARDLILAPDPAARHEPRVRLVAALDDGAGRAGLVVEAAVGHGDRELADVLARTDQPDLLDAVERAFVSGLTSSDRPLWTNELLLAVLRANPMLPRRPTEAGDDTDAALLAVVMDRFDLLDGHDDWQLYQRIEAALRTDPPTDVADRLRRALRRPGPMAEVVRRSAMGGNEEALAAWAETGGHTDDPRWRAAHLFWTRDWPGYDRHDPDGRLLREFLDGPPYEDRRITGMVYIAHRFREIAEEEGRPNPFPPPPPRPARPGSGDDDGRGGGSWPTSYTGDTGFGGHF